MRPNTRCRFEPFRLSCADSAPTVRGIGRAAGRGRGERGYVLGLIGLLIVPLVGFVALATDVGAWYGEATSVQRAADAAALAGVVWMPDTNKARQVALAVAERNGYDDTDPDTEVVVEPVPGNEEQLRVVIRNFDPPIFFAGAFLDDFTIARQAVAEYVLPVPLGSPRNHLGTGGLLGADEEGFWLAINGFCAPMEQGDHRAARFAGNWANGGNANNRICPDATAGVGAPVGPGPNTGAGGNTYWEDNDFYDGSDTYEFYIEHPDNTEDTSVYLYDPGYFNAGGPDPGAGTVTTTFAIRAPDGTPLSDSDNPPYLGCTNLAATNEVAYATDDASVHTATILGDSRWALFCTIPAAAEAGRYIVSAETLVSEFGSDESNAFAVLARRSSLGDTCDSRFTTGCPRVYAKEWMSIYARGNSPQSDFFLAEIEDAHEGKIFRIILFDAGEGGNTISIVDPEGNLAAFDWSTFDGLDSGTNDTFVDVSGTTGSLGPGRASNSRYNERFIEILIPLPPDFAVAYPSGNRWWKVLYDYNANPTDRTTWSASIIGDPVRLVA